MTDENLDNQEGNSTAGQAQTEPNTNAEPVISIPMGDGTTREFTPAEIRKQLGESAERVRGANEKFQKAAEMRKEAERFKRIVEDFTAAQQGDVEALKRLATYEELGITEEAVEGVIAQRRPGRQETGGQAGGGQDNGQPPTQGVLSEDDRRTIDEARRIQQEAKKAQIVNAAMKAVDNDPSLCNIINADKSGQRREAARLYVEEAMRRRVQAGERGASILKNVASDLKQHLQTWGALGTNRPGAQDQEDQSFAGVESPGELPDALAGIDFDSAATGTRSGVHRSQSPPERVSSLDPGYSGHLRNRLAELFKS